MLGFLLKIAFASGAWMEQDEEDVYHFFSLSYFDSSSELSKEFIAQMSMQRAFEEKKVVCEHFLKRIEERVLPNKCFSWK